jgi:hypothetical protein
MENAMINKKIIKKNWFKQHADTIVILSSFAWCFWTLNEKVNDKFSVLSKEISEVKTDVAIIKTVMLMKNIMPSELACHEKR